MKAMTCEMCGSNQFTKNDGLFQCDHCGTKYTPEEAKKLIVSGKVEFTKGEAEKERLIKNIETKIALGQFTDALKRCDTAIEEYPDSVELYKLKLNLHFEQFDGIYSYEDMINLKNRVNNYISVLGFKLNNDYGYYSDAGVMSIFDTFAVLEKLNKKEYELHKEQLLSNYLTRHKKCVNALLSQIENGSILLFQQLLQHKYGSYIPEQLVNYIEKCKTRATMLRLRNLNSLLKYPHTYRKVDVDGCIQPSKVKRIVVATPTEYLVEAIGYWDYPKKTSYIIPTVIRLQDSIIVNNQKEGGNLGGENPTYKIQGLCPYCGGHFKGLFSKKCSKCGKLKDY